MKHFFILFCVLCIAVFDSHAQRSIAPTVQMVVTGKIRQDLEFNLADAANFQSIELPPFIIRNHQGEVKDSVRSLQGFLLKDLLKQLEYPIDKPRELNEFYFTLIASDNYKVVFSYNEIFNSPVGHSLYVVTGRDGKNATELPESILIVSAADDHIGPRYIKGVEAILVSRIH